MFDERGESILLVVIAMIVIGAFIFLGYAINQDIDRKRDCEARGGVYYAPRGKSICLKQDSLIP